MGMSFTRTISSWPSSNVLSSTESGSMYSPANISLYARATRAGVSSSPCRSGSSPTAINSSRTAASARGWSNSGVVNVAELLCDPCCPAPRVRSVNLCLRSESAVCRRIGPAVVLTRVLVPPRRGWGSLRGGVSGLRMGLIRRIRRRSRSGGDIRRLSRSGGDIGVLPVRRRVPVPLLRLLLRRRLLLWRPAGRVPARRGAVVGLGRRVRGNSVGGGPIRAIRAVLVALPRGGLLAGLSDRGLERRLPLRPGPLFAALDRE